jgi:hypothetical protein
VQSSQRTFDLGQFTGFRFGKLGGDLRIFRIQGHIDGVANNWTGKRVQLA